MLGAIAFAGAPPAVPNFASMFNSLNMGGGGGGLGGFGVPAAVSNPETAYATQLEQLRVRFDSFKTHFDPNKQVPRWLAVIRPCSCMQQMALSSPCQFVDGYL